MSALRFICGLAALLICFVSPLAAQPQKPNIVFFLVDDLGVMDIGANNPKTFYETPHIDRLAASGMRFSNGYAACPVCSPTRASILTGKYPQRVGITDYINPAGGNQPEKWQRKTKVLPAAYRDRLALEETTLAEVLKQSGYATLFAGKWHLGPQGFYPEDQGFDVNRGGNEAGGPYGGKRYFSPYGNPRLADGPAGEHLPDRLASETVQFMEANKNRPFLAYLSFYDVHTPLMARPDLEAKYQQKARLLDLKAPIWGAERDSKVRLVQSHAVYAGMVEAMDQAVGKVLNALDRLMLTERTIVVFTTDNGGLSTAEGSPTSNVPYRAGKGWLYDGGIRVPWIIRAPGVTSPGATCDAPVISVAFLPTLCELAAVEAPKPIDGVSLVAALRGKPVEKPPLFWHYPHYGNQGATPGGAIRAGDWKLIEWYEDGKLELFHVRNDIGEKDDLSASQPERRDALHRQLTEWRKSVGALMPTKRPL